MTTNDKSDGAARAAEHQTAAAATPVYGVDADDMLSLFVRLAQSDLSMQMGITLYLGGGGLVSGVLVGRNDWLDLWADASTRNSTTPEAVAAVVERFRHTFRTGPDDEEHPVHYGYIHLRAALVLSGGQLLPAGVDGLWRGRLSMIAGWSFGMVSDG